MPTQRQPAAPRARRPGRPSWVPPTAQPAARPAGGYPPPGTQPLPSRRPTARRAARPGARAGCGRSCAVLALRARRRRRRRRRRGLRPTGTDRDEPAPVSGGLRRASTPSRCRRSRRDNGSVAAVAQTAAAEHRADLAEYDGKEGGATGSGFVLDRQGHVITNNHVVADAAADDGPIEIVDQDGNRYDATVVGRSPVYDLAVLYVEGRQDLRAGRARRLRRCCASATASSRSARRSG